MERGRLQNLPPPVKRRHSSLALIVGGQARQGDPETGIGVIGRAHRDGRLVRFVLEDAQRAELGEPIGEGSRIAVVQAIGEPHDLRRAVELHALQLHERLGAVGKPGPRHHVLDGLQRFGGVQELGDDGRGLGRGHDQDRAVVTRGPREPPLHGGLPRLPLGRRRPAIVDDQHQGAVPARHRGRVVKRLGERENRDGRGEQSQQQEPKRRARRGFPPRISGRREGARAERRCAWAPAA